MPHYQDIKRAMVKPPFSSSELSDEVGKIETAYSQLAQEVVLCHDRFYVDQIAVPALAANFAVVLPAPFPDISYSPLCILDWAAFGRISAIATTGFTVTFSAAAPAVTGGIMRVIVIR